jgi:hypothetical protein
MVSSNNASIAISDRPLIAEGAMTAPRFYECHVGDIDAAQAEGCGEPLVGAYITEMATDLANTIFLKPENE